MTDFIFPAPDPEPLWRRAVRYVKNHIVTFIILVAALCTIASLLLTLLKEK